MTSNNYILGSYFIFEIEEYVFDFLDLLVDFDNLRLLNKYYKILISNDNRYLELMDFKKAKKRNHYPTKPENYLIQACEMGFTEIAKSLIRKYHFFPQSLVGAFISSCNNGSIEIAKFLLSCSNNRKELLYCFDLNVEACCQNNHKDMVDFLIDFYTEAHQDHSSIDHSYMFQKLYRIGSFKSAKKIYELSLKGKYPINLEKSDHFIFKDICSRRLLELAEWLTTFNAKYKIRKDKGKLARWWIE